MHYPIYLIKVCGHCMYSRLKTQNLVFLRPAKKIFISITVKYIVGGHLYKQYNNLSLFEHIPELKHIIWTLLKLFTRIRLIAFSNCVLNFLAGLKIWFCISKTNEKNFSLAFSLNIQNLVILDSEDKEKD